MAKSNIEQFDEYTGKIFAILFAKFPVPTFLKMSEVEPNGLEFSEHTQMLVLNADGRFFAATAEWLREAGYVRFSEISQDGYVQKAVLSAKALEVLKAIPNSLTSSSIGEQLQEAAKGGMLDALKGLTNEALSRGLAMATTAAVNYANNT